MVFQSISETRNFLFVCAETGATVNKLVPRKTELKGTLTLLSRY